MKNQVATPYRIALVVAVLAVLLSCEKEDGAETSVESMSLQTEITSPVGFVWKWEGTQTPVERIVPADPTQYTLEFLPDTTVVAQIDCNSGHGKYVMDGPSIAIGPLATTRMACPPGSLDAKFLQHLEAARHLFFRGDTLFMDLFADSGTMKFSQMPEPSQQ
ncbi:MAG: META domain-containing protein [Candidatus Latescibacteria bacterium]|nr:META domain-containing protein [Candidatus Latescibacterota bacterium]